MYIYIIVVLLIYKIIIYEKRNLFFTLTTFEFCFCDKENHDVIHNSNTNSVDDFSKSNSESFVDIELVYNRYYDKFKIDNGPYEGATYVDCSKAGNTCAIYEGIKFKKPVLEAVSKINSGNTIDYFKNSKDYQLIFPKLSHSIVEEIIEGKSTVYIERDKDNNPVFVFCDKEIKENETNSENIHFAIIIKLN